MSTISRPPGLYGRVHRRSLFVFAVALVLAAASVAAPAAMAAARAQPQPAAKGLSATAAADLSRIRRDQGLGPVTADPVLTALAQRQADAMAAAGRMSHEVAGSLSSRVGAAGVKAGHAAENVAVGQATWAAVLRDWMASSGHRSNILLGPVTRVGVARAEGAGKPYWALVLASPEPAQRRPEGGSAWPYGGFGIPVPVPFR